MQNERPRAVPKRRPSAQNDAGDPLILHILNRAQWAAAQLRGYYRPASLETEGFIHCSMIDQLVATANKYYRGQGDLLVLRIEERKLTSRLKVERPASPE